MTKFYRGNAANKFVHANAKWREIAQQIKLLTAFSLSQTNEVLAESQETFQIKKTETMGSCSIFFSATFDFFPLSFFFFLLFFRLFITILVSMAAATSGRWRMQIREKRADVKVGEICYTAVKASAISGG